MTTAALTTPSAPTATKPLRIIYADDMRELRHVAEMALTRDGHSITCVEHGELALERISADPSGFDVVITDHHMPIMNGLELVTSLRNNVPYEGKVIVFSSELSPTVNMAYKRLNVDHVIPKPVFPSKLRELLAQIGNDQPQRD